ncbi:MAG: DUF3301 domain-containing protein [Chromatiaceae bacterium]|jgi:hypothetical protein|nr:DUF3301 domain-containing protein [Chromatiaceae bacterium]
MDKLLAILTLLLLGWFWLDSLRAREMATEICRTICKQRNLQFLDQTVSLRHLRLRRTDTGLRLRRVYAFDFSEEGIGRHGGYLVLVGLDLESISLGLPEQPADG